MLKARLVAVPTDDRIDQACGDGSRPALGDVVQLDQGFTFPDGRSGGIVYCQGSDGSIRWGADVYDFEIQVIE